MAVAGEDFIRASLKYKPPSQPDARHLLVILSDAMVMNYIDFGFQWCKKYENQNKSDEITCFE